MCACEHVLEPATHSPCGACTVALVHVCMRVCEEWFGRLPVRQVILCWGGLGLGVKGRVVNIGEAATALIVCVYVCMCMCMCMLT